MQITQIFLATEEHLSRLPITFYRFTLIHLTKNRNLIYLIWLIFTDPLGGNLCANLKEDQEDHVDLEIMGITVLFISPSGSLALEAVRKFIDAGYLKWRPDGTYL